MHKKASARVSFILVTLRPISSALTCLLPPLDHATSSPPPQSKCALWPPAQPLAHLALADWSLFNDDVEEDFDDGRAHTFAMRHALMWRRTAGRPD